MFDEINRLQNKREKIDNAEAINKDFAIYINNDLFIHKSLMIEVTYTVVDQESITFFEQVQAVMVELQVAMMLEHFQIELVDHRHHHVGLLETEMGILRKILVYLTEMWDTLLKYDNFNGVFYYIFSS